MTAPTDPHGSSTWCPRCRQPCTLMIRCDCCAGKSRVPRIVYDPADAASVLDFVDAAMAAGTIVAWGAVRRHTDNGVVFCVHDDSTPCAREHEDEWPTFYVAAPEGT